jgi:hypothetical protein
MQIIEYQNMRECPVGKRRTFGVGAQARTNYRARATLIQSRRPECRLPHVRAQRADGTPAASVLVDLGTLFGRTAPVTLEIGFGDGEQLATLAALRRCLVVTSPEK